MINKILVTAALPYANGHIHIGHLLEYLQTDIWVRFQKLRGKRCLFICADDTHGTAIMNRARTEGRAEESLLAEMAESHQRDFAGFGIEFDHYGSTNSPANREICHYIWSALRNANLIVERDVIQLYDAELGTSLADRFVKGTCPKCKAPGQYGDSCEKCQATYSPIDLIDPVSTLTGTKPVLKSAPHLFVKLEPLREFLTDWTQSGDHLQNEVANYLKGNFLGEVLRDWDVSRPAPYFGFEIPDSPGNYWYVWFDAPIGYIAATKEWCDRTGESFDSWWRSPETQIHHFIGKDITYFHTLFWPAMLKVAGFALPSKVHIHGFLTVAGEKMSKSKGTFILARTYLKHLDPAYLRYYLASKLGSRLDDLDLNLEEFVNKVNSDLVGKLVNLASRTARFAVQSGLSKSYPEDGGLFARAAAEGEAIAACYEQREFSQAIRSIIALADAANKYVEERAPWTLKKDPGRASELQDVCTVALNLYRQLIIYLKPVLPKLAADTEELLNTRFVAWNDAYSPILGTPIGEFKHLMTRVDEKEIAQMLEESKETIPGEAAAPAAELGATGSASAAETKPSPLEAEPLAATCSIDEFVKVDLRVAQVLSAEKVEGSDKLLKLTVSLGSGDPRTIFAGIQSAYAPESLVGRLIIVVANLAPRKMRFGLSEGMVLAAGSGGKEVYVLSPDSGALPGHRIH